MSKYYLIQDYKNCIACKACEVQCKTHAKLPQGPQLTKIIRTNPIHRKDNPKEIIQENIFMPCFHCENAVCQNVCPTGAIKKREDGIVYIDSAMCIGCKSCITACPWGACQWNPETHKAVKCDYCMDRLDQGKKPSCVTICVTQCLKFGVAKNLPTFKRERFADKIINTKENHL